MTDKPLPRWRRSSHSGSGPDANCVEVAQLADTVLVRDSKLTEPGSPTLAVSSADWSATLLEIDRGR
jgi:hypothetical protein